MRLNSLKLAGFKSFVDPLTIAFPSNLVGIVGPNGCGKSNIVDAIRWVMGETSAKQLRGESMSDVIFNGSTARKPVGQAMVELEFDNSDGSIGGEYAQYSTIAIKRQVSREGQSDYFLNGTKCRRKDIIDIFLGTGLGPHSYSVIEQGMISRFIEAKPDELRMYIEEAAGVSKYKERRRETETRIRHTRENLERLEDLRQEVAKQVETLRKQASAAEKYKVLKEEEHHTKAQCLALNWRHLDEQSRNQDKLINNLTVKIEAKVAEQRHVGAELEKQRERQIEINDEFNAIQARYYALGAEVARLEQSITHHRERLAQLRSDQAQVEQNWSDLQSHLTTDQQRIEQFSAELAELTPSLETAQSAEANSNDILANAERTMHEWQAQWDAFNQAASETVQKARVEQTRIQHLEQQIVAAEKRLERIQAEQAQINFDHLDQQINDLNQQQDNWQTKLNDQQNNLGEIVKELTQQRENLETLNHNLDDLRNRVQTARGRHASLQALQQAALGSGSGSAKHWLQEHQLSQQARLAQKLDVTPGWELAVETVLGPYLEAVCVENTSGFAKDFAGLGEGEVILFDAQSGASKQNLSANFLAAHIRSDYAAQTLLMGIHCAEDLDAALAMRASLADGASVVTRDGMWLGKNWLRVSKSQDNNRSVIKREKELSELSAQLQEDEQKANALKAELQVQREKLTALEMSRDTLQRELNQVRDQANKITTQLAVQKASRDRLAQRMQQLQTEQTEQQNFINQSHLELVQLRESWQTAVAAIEQDEQRRLDLSATRTSLRDALDMAREKSNLDKAHVYQLNLRVENARTQLHAAQENVTRMQHQLQNLQERREQLQVALAPGETPIENLQQELQSKLQVRAQEETQLSAVRKQVEELNEQLRNLEHNRDELSQAAENLRGELQQLQLDLQTYAVRRTTFEEQITALEYQLETILAELTAEMTLELAEQELQSILNRIQRLGAINLMAIDEVVVQEERAKYLDAQFADLNEALTTLENAIRKIDHETKTRFQETFETVNKSFQELFPRVFGGGSAHLELTGEDLLNTGISVMARPPGKRNTSIHLLSGGEKALTAVSLVFAIFQLNPAPFCLLDEVDAPLDDSNVARFCNLVREMSSQVQFMFISHNKLAIEMAEHLTGVTMNEPGVSRIVAVSVQEAVELASA